MTEKFQIILQISSSCTEVRNKKDLETTSRVFENTINKTIEDDPEEFSAYYWWASFVGFLKLKDFSSVIIDSELFFCKIINIKKLLCIRFHIEEERRLSKNIRYRFFCKSLVIDVF